MDLSSRLKHYRISDSEYAKICELLGRQPKDIEWALFSALWSEHCSYKSSRIHLKKFYAKNARVLEAFGENAGVIDLGEGERVAFKMESHNHPSYIEPYQGAATGVGGILRDIFTMGARPIAVADYLCFGEPSAHRMPALVDGVVRGIGGYGNCVGVPNITGQTEFHASYNGNILVNALAVGLFRPGEPVVNSKARGVGNFVVYVGAKTGKDGVHGASMASESFDESSESKKPTVQIGDPFFEKLLIESCIEVMAEDLVVAIQDMGAAGLTSSSFEMAAKGDVGITLHLDKIPLRDSKMNPEEILLSESQERMLLVCEPKKFEDLQEVFEKWHLDACVVGEVKEKRTVELYWHGELLTEIDPWLLTENAPLYERPYTIRKREEQPVGLQVPLQPVENAKEKLLDILSDIRGCSRKWISRQYDQRVGAKTVRDASQTVGVLRLPDTGRALGLVLGCRPHIMRFDPGVGAMDAVFYPGLELAIKGFEPLAATDCLNFGNPEKPDLMGEFVASVEGISAACKAIDTPVISGNVSFYNETLEKNVTSTPSTGIVGLRSSALGIPSNQFLNEGEELVLVGLPQIQLSGMISEAAGGIKGSGNFDCELMADFLKFCREVSSLASASRLVGRFGIAYALSRLCTEKMGCDVDLHEVLMDPNHPEASLFGEVLYQVVFVGPEGLTKKINAILSAYSNLQGEVHIDRIGKTKLGSLNIKGLVQVDLKEISESYHSGWRKNFETLA